MGRLSLVVSTLGRTSEMQRLFDSLETQSNKQFDVIVVDQNNDDRIASIVQRFWSFPVIRLREPCVRGLSRGRNVGWRRSTSDVILFPDDDCWYPPWFIERGMNLLQTAKLDVLCGRSTDEAGRSINARYAPKPTRINRQTVWIAQIEWATFISRRMLDVVGGYDEALGIGAVAPWQAAEGPDLILRVLKRGGRCYYDPSLFGYHAEIDINNPTDRAVRKARAYARGMGYVLRKHHYGLLSLAYWVSRSLFNVLSSAMIGEFDRARFYFSIARGRVEGWTRWVAGPLEF